MKNSVIGFPRIGSNRELKFISEKYFQNKATLEDLNDVAKSIRQNKLISLKKNNIDFIPVNDFSLFDSLLDTAIMLNIIPERYRKLDLNSIDLYFSIARGYQGKNGDVKALPLKKWFNTNYHYIEPEYDQTTNVSLNCEKILNEINEAKELNIEVRPTFIGPFTFIKLTRFNDNVDQKNAIINITKCYCELLKTISNNGCNWVDISEPYLVKDLTENDKKTFLEIYLKLLEAKKQNSLKINLTTYFGDIRDFYQEIVSLDFDGISLDFCEGKETLNLIKKYGFPKEKLLTIGIINGKNIWKSNYSNILNTINQIQNITNNICIGTSCSLQHVPVSVENEHKLPNEILKYFSFAIEKITELKEISDIFENPDKFTDLLSKNKNLFNEKRVSKNESLAQKIANLTDKDFTRTPAFSEREKIQKLEFNFPILPTTTIGSFPQTSEVRTIRKNFKNGVINDVKYYEEIQNLIKNCIHAQEELGLDVLVHGEFERNDMVEYFGEHLDGYIFTENAWVQSYGTRCVKPPIIWGDITRKSPITVETISYAQSLTNKPVKGMLTGPVTIFNWSFPREDISIKESILQIALAIKDEVQDLEKAGIRIIQIDEAALKEKLPLRKSDWNKEYLDFAIPAFRLVHSNVKPQTQIHTHMCYSEFSDIIKNIDEMDADVITFEASRSNLDILDTLKNSSFKTNTGPGIYDIHSPRVPSVEELKQVIKNIISKFPIQKTWINPDCGLKTRRNEEVKPSLANLVTATKEIRKTLNT